MIGNKRRLQLEMAMRKQDHPAVKESRQYYRREFFMRLMRAIFLQGPAFTLLFPVAVSLADAVIGNPPFHTTLEYFYSNGIETLLYRAGEIYLLGLLFSLWDGMLKPWHSPIEETIEMYMEIEYALDHDG